MRMECLRRFQLLCALCFLCASARNLLLLPPRLRASVRTHLLQRAIPRRAIHIRRQHRHPMLARIADDLRRGVEAHRLRVQQRSCEGRREVALQPARNVNQMGKARRVAFGEAVFAEPLDLVEAARGEIGIVAARDHAADHHVLQLGYHSARTERRHRFAQPVGLGARELRRVERDLHRLLLEDRHPQRAPEDRGQLVGRAVFGARRGDFDFLRAAPPFEEGVDHVALDRPGANDRHFDDEIVETARAQARQHVHLRAALHLEHAERIALAQHVVNRGSSRGTVASVRLCP